MREEKYDQLESFIKQNREGFDAEVPSSQVWDKIDNNLGADKKKTPTEIWWKAAAVFFFVLSGYLLLNQTKPFVVDNEIDNKENSIPTNLNPEFKNVEFYYTSLIEEKKNEIYKYNEDCEVDAGCFEEDMKKLDAMYLVLKEELGRNGSEQVIDALILNLLIRIDRLNDQLQKLEVIRDEGNDSAESGNKSV